MSFFIFFFFFIVIQCQVKKGSSMNNNNRNLQNEFTNIRLEVDKICVENNYNIDYKKLYEGIDKAKNAIEKLVKIQRTSDTIYINRDVIPCSIYL